MIDWPAELGSSGPTSVNSMATNDNIPTRIELVGTGAEVKFYPCSNTTFSDFFCPIVSFFYTTGLQKIKQIIFLLSKFDSIFCVMFLLKLNHEIPITKGPCNEKRTKGKDSLVQEQHSNY